MHLSWLSSKRGGKPQRRLLLAHLSAKSPSRPNPNPMTLEPVKRRRAPRTSLHKVWRPRRHAGNERDLKLPRRHRKEHAGERPKEREPRNHTARGPNQGGGRRRRPRQVLMRDFASPPLLPTQSSSVCALVCEAPIGGVRLEPTLGVLLVLPVLGPARRRAGGPLGPRHPRLHRTMRKAAGRRSKRAPPYLARVRPTWRPARATPDGRGACPHARVPHAGSRGRGAKRLKTQRRGTRDHRPPRPLR